MSKIVFVYCHIYIQREGALLICQICSPVYRTVAFICWHVCYLYTCTKRKRHLKSEYWEFLHMTLSVATIIEKGQKKCNGQQVFKVYDIEKLLEKTEPYHTCCTMFTSSYFVRAVYRHLPVFEK